LIPRAAALRRIAKLYGIVEEMHSVALRQASGSVREAEVSIRGEREASVLAAGAGRAALTAGEREAWLLAQAEGEVSSVRAMRLEGLKKTRLIVELAARAAFIESRIQAEQMKQVVTQMVDQNAIEEGRRTQAASDDRYAARRAWSSGRSKRST
jgi:hypothetical protein